MDDVRIIAAIIAGIVSLVGIFVNVYLSKVTIKHEHKKLLLNLEEDAKSKEMEEMRVCAKTLELIRITSWEIQGEFMRGKINQTSPDMPIIVSLVQKLDQLVKEYLIQWANAKAAISPQLMSAVTKEHHDLRESIAYTRLCYFNYCRIEEVESDSDAQETSRAYAAFDQSIDELRKVANNFIQLLADIRLSIVHDK